jgi:hypothetical protein
VGSGEIERMEMEEMEKVGEMGRQIQQNFRLSSDWNGRVIDWSVYD